MRPEHGRSEEPAILEPDLELDDMAIDARILAAKLLNRWVRENATPDQLCKAVETLGEHDAAWLLISLSQPIGARRRR